MASHPLPPLPPQPSLSQTINTSTRRTHHKLNTHILSLLPLSLPPHTSTPILYAKGMTHILPIYESFERAFKLLESCAEFGERRGPVAEGLRRLWIPELERAGRLRRDLGRLCSGGSSSYDTIGEESAPRLKALTRHISEATERQPHLLLAYTWLLYMALFSGGRYIRARLRDAGTEFWTGGESEKGGKVDEVLSFWTFEGGEDGEDVKADFKQRFAELEECLTGQETEEVVEEATYIMDAMMGVVEEIAKFLERNYSCPKAAGRSLERHDGPEKDESTLRWLGLKHILPMGMFELITGASKAVMMGIEPLYGKI